jgi:hypothetical protein
MASGAWALYPYERVGLFRYPVPGRPRHVPTHDDDDFQDDDEPRESDEAAP